MLFTIKVKVMCDSNTIGDMKFTVKHSYDYSISLKFW